MLYVFEHEEIKSCEDCPFLDDEQICFCTLLDDKLLRDSPGIEFVGRDEECPLMKTGIASKL